MCKRNMLIHVPPRTCIHGGFDRPEYASDKDLSGVYSLTPGSYTITPRLRTGEEKRSTTGPPS